MFIVTGSGRSGTSAVAKLLHTAGISVGRDLIEPDASNADGYFEERAVVALNDRILRSAGLFEWFSQATREQIIEAAAAHEGDMRALMEDATPAWKDPRFSWTLEAWLPHFPTPPRIIVCLRSPNEVVASTLRYFGLAGDDPSRAVVHLWRAQYERLLDVIDAHRLSATSIEYDALHAGVSVSLHRLSTFVGCELSPVAVRPDLRHHRSEVAPELRALYERVRALAEGTATRAAGDGASPSTLAL